MILYGWYVRTLDCLFFLLLLVCSEWRHIVSHKLHHRVTRQTLGLNSSCTTPDGQRGTCTALKSCQPLLKLFEDAASSRSFLRKSLCSPRESHHQAIVCCANIKCGTSVNSKVRVVGGNKAKLGVWPWMTAIGYRRKNEGPTSPSFNCGGSLISGEWVITAGHCVRNLRSGLEPYMVRLGDLDLNDAIKDNATPVDVKIKEIITHPNYTRTPSITNDVALIRLETIVQYSAHIRPICLLVGREYQNNKYYERKKPYITGWGAIREKGPSSTHLLETSISMVDAKKCAEQYREIETVKIDTTVLCAAEPGKDTCQGDSGGPLIFPNIATKTLHLGGIVSFGIGCANDTYPGVYTKVAAYTDWIRQTTGLHQ